MRTALATRADNTIKEMTDITHPIMREYAKKIGADFIVLDDNKGLHHHYRILQFYDLFDTYDRIISMDSDVIIAPDCPNLFEVVPEDKIGTVYEDIFSRKWDRQMRILKAQQQFGNLNWTGGYINTGVAVFSKCHRELFKKRELYMDLGYDDVYLGYWIVKLGFKVYSLNPKFNYMHHFDEGGTNRLYAYIIHYAGQGFDGDRMGGLKRDYGFFYGDPPHPELKNQAIIDEIGDAKSIADIGCGEGFLTNWLIKHTKATIYPIDVVDENRMNLKVLIGDLTEPENFPIKSVEVSIASEVLEHIRWWKEALQTLLDISERKVIITIPYGTCFWSPDHLNFWDDESVREFIALCDGWDVKIKKILSKPEDVKDNYLLFLIVCTKLTKGGKNTTEALMKSTFPTFTKPSELVI
jgi:hypothetical protein